MPGRETIVDRDHDRARLVGQLRAQRVVRIEVAHDPATPVEVHHRRRRLPGSVRPVHASADASERAGLHRFERPTRWTEPAEYVHALARLAHRQLARVAPPDTVGQRDEELALRVEQLAVALGAPAAQRAQHPGR